MNTLKSLIKKYLRHFAYFYSHLRFRIFISLGLSLTVGVLDGFGLAMFLPLLQLVDGGGVTNPEALGNLRFLTDGLQAMGVTLTIGSVLLVIVVFFLCKGIFRFIESYYRVLLAHYFIRKVRFAQIDKLTNFSYQAFVSSDVGRIQNTLSGEVSRVQQGYRSYFMAVQSGIMVLVYVALAFLANPQFAGLVLAGALLSNLMYRRIYTFTKEASKKITQSGHAFQALLIQKVTFFKYLKATGLIKTYAEKLKTIITDMEEVTRKMGWYNSILTSTKEPLIVLVVAGVIMVQVNFFGTGLGVIILSLLFFYRSLTFLMNVQNQWNSFLSVSGSLENMTEFMKGLMVGQEKSGKEKISRLSGQLELKNISFAYGATPVLQNISLVIPKNETVAFVGESGSGKTTLVNVLSGLLRPAHGDFIIDGQNAIDLHLPTYQRRIGYITQEPVIFSDTIYNNVTFWAERTPENESRLWEALRKASIDEFVKTLPDKENSLLGNNGIMVSGGQKQRFSIARELYKDVDILIMDEATSSLDSETERTIRENIDALKGKYTILIIAHRLSTIKNADRVVLLSKGRIESVGDFESLRNSSKLFEKMVELQEV
jgi:ABC-type multidrug transport system fused ATPase/permease subunit